MRRHLGIGPVQTGIEPVGLDHGRLQVARSEKIGHHGLRHTAQKGEQPDMGKGPVLQPLRGHRLGTGVIRRPHRAADAPIAATNSFMARASPVTGSITSIVSPAKSTKAFSPPTCVGRTRPFQASKCSQNQAWPNPSGARARYSSHNSARVTPGRRNSTSIAARSGTGRSSRKARVGLANSSNSKLSSSSSEGCGQDKLGHAPAPDNPQPCPSQA